MNTNDIFEAIKSIVTFLLFVLIKNTLIYSFIYIFTYILTSLTIYKVAKAKGINNAYLAWLPIFRDLLTIEIGQGNKLYYLSVFLFFIPGVRFLGLIPIYIYLSIMKYKIIKEYDGYSKLFIICDLLPFVFLINSPLLFLRSYLILSIPIIISLIKTCRNIRKQQNYNLS